MASQIDISWCYSDHSGDEYWFYDSIPGAQHKCWTSDGGPFSRGGDALHYLIYSGAAVLSSKVLAAAIRAYLTSRKDKVRITVSGANKMEVRYEGPSFSDEESAIEAMIDKMVDDSGSRKVTVQAKPASTEVEVQMASPKGKIRGDASEKKDASQKKKESRGRRRNDDG